ncbi:OCIA domain-containing protein 1 [Sarcoptes scabiei]|uniref:OCIA domain-containing protein 1 n=1 Tax=Sarcoptes scabiei TaxID=52283 RepID=A0A834R0G1_SARSC|nr:OCIA domain-containing protein 1 [Sarcoptes scabiei]
MNDYHHQDRFSNYQQQPQQYDRVFQDHPSMTDYGQDGRLMDSRNSHQQPSQLLQQQQDSTWSSGQTLDQTKKNIKAKQYNDFLERQGIPAISESDIQIINQCNRESFFYRSVPMAAALCLGTHYLGRKFNFRPGFYHFFGASLLGYFGGKMSYRSICQERLIASKSNSPFVNAIRKRQGVFVQNYDDSMNVQENFMESDWTIPSSQSSSTISKASEFDEELPFQQRKRFDHFGNENDSHHHYHSQHHHYQEQQSEHSNNLNLSNRQHQGSEHQPSDLTYDDLRNRNRAAYRNI